MTDLPDPHPDTSPERGVDAAELRSFWELAKVKAKLNRLAVYTGGTVLDTLPPPAWAFGATRQEADELLALVLRGVKTATSSALWDYEVTGEPIPQAPCLSIVLDGAAHPRALIETRSVQVVAFDQVGEDHARAEGEGDRTLGYWREAHRRFFTLNATHHRGFASDMPVVLERFAVIYPKPRDTP